MEHDTTARSRVLVIEDDEAYRYVLTRSLEARGFDVLPFENGLPVLDYLDKGGRVDAMVTDLQLPTRTPNGISMALMVRQRKPDLPVVMITGFSNMAAYVDGQWGVLMQKSSGTGAILESLYDQGLRPASEPDGG